MASKPIAWRMARALDTLLLNVNAFAPNRSKSSDGGIGDAAHASRSSDHNPWVKIGNDNVVTARDLTHDPAGGLDCNALADALIRSADPRIKYIIWDKRICSGAGQGQAAWTWRKYTGSNQHTKHLHISVKPEAQFCDSTKNWTLPSKTDAAPGETLARGATGKYVTDLQSNLTLLGYFDSKIDGVFGKATEDAVRAFQAHKKLLVDGVAGIRTNTAIGEAIKAKETAPKIAAAKQVVAPAAKDGISATDIGAGVIAVAPAVTATRQIAEDVSNGVTTLISLGPWIFAALCGVGLGSYIYWNERQKRKAAKAALEAMS